VCVVGELVFLGLVFTMRGRWSPRAAKRDFEEHERRVAVELAKIRGTGATEEIPELVLAPTGTDGPLWVRSVHVAA